MDEAWELRQMVMKHSSFKARIRERLQHVVNEPDSVEATEAKLRVPRFMRAPHTIIAGRVMVYLSEFVEKRDLGYVTGDVDTVLLSTDRYTVRAPDVGFISKSRVPPSTGKVIRVPPDLAVKVVMPNETKKAIEDKVLNYMRHGTRVVWVIYPTEQVVDVYRLTKKGKIEIERYDIDRSLDGGDILPGLRLPVSSIFPRSTP